jgi:moderate conductance mechanosensitive channel
MRKFIVFALFLSFLAFSVCAEPAATPSSSASASAAAGASNPSPVTLTPDQAKRALDALNDPKTRTKITDTLRAIAAAGALSAPPASAASGASAAPAPASGASVVLAAIAQNGLVSQLSRQTAATIRHAASSVKASAAALLDVHSVRAWWGYEIESIPGRAQLRELAGTLSASLLPAWLVGVLLARLLKKHIEALGNRGVAREAPAVAPEAMPVPEAGTAADGGMTAGGAQADAASADAIPLQAAGVDARSIETDAERAARSQRNAARAVQHWSLLQRLPFALLHTLLKAVPLAVSVVIAVVAMSLLTDDGTPEEAVLDTLIQVYAIARVVALACGLLLASDAPKLRLLPISDESAVFVERWLMWLVAVVAVGIALAEAPVPLGLSPEAHLGIVKTVTLVGHIMVAVLILQVRRPVRQWIRDATGRTRAFKLVGQWLAGAWAYIAVFIVIALWFIWALDVRDGYRIVLGRGGISLGILIGARLAAIVASGVLGRMFRSTNGEKGSIALARAHRYYPMLRGIITVAIVLAAANFVLSIWDLHPWQAFVEKDLGRRLVSAIVTVAIAAFAAIAVWEAINVSIERRLLKWTTAGDLMRAARLRTLLPMLRTTLFIGIALVVGLTGLSEIGVNIGPLLAGASIFGVALGFGSQKLVQDFITGMFLLMENAMQVGDWVTVAGVSGTVEYLSIRTVRLRGGDGSLHTIPFSSVTTVNNSNRGLGNASVKINIAYGQDVDLAVQTLNDIGASLREDPKFKDGIVSDFSFWGVDQVDGAMVTLLGQMQCRDTARWPVQREFNRRILEMFRARGIEIANPLRSTVVVPAQGGNGATAENSVDDPAQSDDEQPGPPAPKSDGSQHARGGLDASGRSGSKH